MIDDRASQDVFHSLMLDLPREKVERVHGSELADYLCQRFLPLISASRVEDLNELKRWVLMSKLILLLDGCPVGLMLDAESVPSRQITEPVVESVVAGPRDSFVESLKVNTALVRGRLGDVKLKSENYILGRRTNTMVTLMFVEDIANPKIVEEARKRIRRIDIDGIIDSSYLKELIQDTAYSLFPLIKRTERPDRVVADLLEGRFVLLVEGSPMVLTAPSIFVDFLQSPEDYYQNPLVGVGLRILRQTSLFLSTSMPAIYVAITTYHQEMLPIPLIFNVSGAREAVPFPAFLEALLMLALFELLWEAGVRLPRVVGAAVNIVGALILGQAVIQAGFVSPAMVVVIAVAAIANFTMGSNYELASGMRLIRVITLAGGAALGLYGYALVVMVFLIYMAGLRSFGVPYMGYMNPLIWKPMKDIIFRAPIWDATQRPSLFRPLDPDRSKTPRPSPAAGRTPLPGENRDARKRKDR